MPDTIPSTDPRIEALQMTLQACVEALASLPKEELSVSQYRLAAELTYKLAYNCLPGGTAGFASGDTKRNGMEAGWAWVASAVYGKKIEPGKSLSNGFGMKFLHLLNGAMPREK